MYWIWGKGKDLILGENSIVTQVISESKTMKAKITEEIENYKKGEFTGEGTLKFTRKEPDLWLGVRRANYKVSINEVTETKDFLFFRTTKTRYVVDVKVWDTYNFNKGDETGDGIGSLLNNLGYWAQQHKMGKEYYWEARYVYKTRWK